MRLSRITVKNFRNFHSLDVLLGPDVVLVGENGSGKSNLVYALRLLLDPTLPDSARQLKDEDFWDGLKRPLKAKDEIVVAVDLVDFDGDNDQLALLTDHMVTASPMTARLTYVFRKDPKVVGDPKKPTDYEFSCYGGDRPENNFGYNLRSKIQIALLPALRDAENDIANWRRSPLRPLLDRATSTINRQELEKVASAVHAAGLKLGGIKEITDAAKAVNTRQERMVGSHYASDISLGLAPSDPDRLIRALRVYIDGGKRSISDASLGTANLLYLCLKALDFENLAIEGDRVHTFVAIEEPEAHLHPHLQRLVYRDFLRARTAHGRVQEREEVARPLSVLLTTHSPNIASVTPLESLVMLRRCSDGSTEASSAVGLSLEAQDIADLERYLDVSRGEMLFSRGIIFVEGESELYLVPTLAKLAGIDFEQLGITVCSIGGINFTPYVRLMSASGLNVPFAVITDGDPNLEGERIGVRRVRRLVEALTGSKVSPQEDEAKTLVRASKFGLFVGDHTFETDLFKSGRHRSMCNVLAQLTTSKIVKVRAKSWKADPDSLNRDRFISDIEKIGKGRFAQRLATQVKGSFWPKYIQRAVEYLQSKVT